VGHFEAGSTGDGAGVVLGEAVDGTGWEEGGTGRGAVGGAGPGHAQEDSCVTAL